MNVILLSKKKRRVFLSWLIILSLQTFLTAISPQKSITQYKLDIWQERHSVFAITQTHDGYIWLGTSDGLVRFDGINFTLFNKENTPQLKANLIETLYQDRNGTLWIGKNYGGLAYLKNGKFGIYTTGKHPYFDGILALIEDREGLLWVGSYSGISSVNLRNGDITHYTGPNQLDGFWVYDIREDNAGNLWFGGSAGISKRTPNGKFVKIDAPNKTQDFFVYNMITKTANQQWVGGSNGLYHINGGKIKRYGIARGLPDLTVMALHEDRDGNFWVGTDGGGLSRIQEGTIQTLSTQDGMACGYVYSIYEDKEGSLWAGTLDGGLHRFCDTPITMFTSKEGLLHDTVNKLYLDRAGKIWICTDAGLNRLSIKKRKYSLETVQVRGMSNLSVHDVIEDRNGDILIATATSGLLRFNPGTGNYSSYNTKNGLSHNRAKCIVEDKKGTIWVGTKNGLNRIRNGKVTVFTTKDGLLNASVRCLYLDSKENLWIGFEKGGVNKLKDGRFTAYRPGKDHRNPRIECFFENSDGTLYIGTHSGMSVLVNGEFINYTTRSGLIENHVNSILDDGAGHLWLSSRGGISRISKKELKAYDAGRLPTIYTLTFNEQDGMKTRWCSSSSLKTADGRLWFATFKGLAMLDPARINKNEQPPSVILEGFKIDGESINIYTAKANNSLRIPPGNKRLEFNYTAPSFLKPEAIKFRIKLEGYDRQWIDMGNKRSTVYTRLSPGKYTFRVIACNSDGIWNRTGDSFSFYLQPFFYQTTWFYILVIALPALLIYAGFRIRMRRLLLKKKQLTILVQKRTHSLKERTIELQTAHENLNHSKQIIEEKNRHIYQSIEYAQRIQQAVLPSDDKMHAVLNDYFVIYKPKDIVSGDFYWFAKNEAFGFVASSDCTGHGVPGAFLSMIGNIKLNDNMTQKFISDPALLLNHLHLGVRQALKQEEKVHLSDDGMEIGLCMLDLTHDSIIFAGAKRPLYYIKNNTFNEIKGDRKPIGGRQKEAKRQFTNHVVNVDSKITCYLSSDGFADQNNSENKKYGTKRLKEFLLNHSHLTLPQQKEALLKELSDFQGEEEQRDDISIIGFTLFPPDGSSQH
ncbi:MAG: SpoIIE family protein phosphatase [bacterium]|nr:SpoIIE family protein phosphatase [bacterium]